MRFSTRIRSELSYPLVRKQECIKKAREMLIEHNVTQLPVNPFEIAVKRGWCVGSFQYVQMVNNVDATDLFAGNEAMAIRIGQGCFYILYDNDIKNRRRVRWSFAHEIGHVSLGHLDHPELYENDLLYEVLEREADLFAAEFLAPLPVLKLLNATDYITIMELCCISKAAALQRAYEVRKCGKQTELYYSILEKQFKSFVINNIQRKHMRVLQ